MSYRLPGALLLEGGGVVSLVGAGGKTSLMYRLAAELAGGGQTVLTTTTTHIYPPAAAQCAVCILAPTADQVLAAAAGRLAEHRHITAAAGRVDASGKLLGLAPAEIDRLRTARVFDWIIVEADGAAGRPLKAPGGREPVIPACTGWVVGLIGLAALGRPLTEQWVFRPEFFARITGLALGAAVTAEAVAALFAHAHGLLKGAPALSRGLAFMNQADTPERRAAGDRIAALIKRAGGSRLRRAIVGQVLGEPPVSAVFDL
jgi:probable selenium-dependent hydroxylase accessory protein YqeC